MSDLYDALCHQMCTVYPATAKAVPFLIELLGQETIRCRGRILQFLADAAFAGSVLQDADAGGDRKDGEGGDESEEIREEAVEAMRLTSVAVWAGWEAYIAMLSDDDPRIRVIAPYLLGTLASQPLPSSVPSTTRETIEQRLREQYEEEPSELVRASIVFGLTCMAKDSDFVIEWLEARIEDADAPLPIQLSAAICLASCQTELSDSVLNILLAALENPQRTNACFQGTELENRHHPIGRAMLQADGKSVDDPSGEESPGEDFNFPWPERWSSTWTTFRILHLLSRANPKSLDRIVSAVAPYLKEANPYTCDSIVPPIVRLVFEHPLTPEVQPETLSPPQLAVLRCLYDNVRLWATNQGHSMYAQIGLGERRDTWSRLLNVVDEATDERINEILSVLQNDRQRRGEAPVTTIRLCRIGTAAFLPHLKQYPDLEILDFAATQIGDEALAQIADLPNLLQLRLNSTLVGDQGISELVKLAKLEELYLAETGVTDACLEYLAQLPKLKYACLLQTQVTEAAVRKFRDENPNCRIVL